MKIAIVEDEGITVLFLKNSITSLGHQVFGIYDNGQGILKHLETQEIDVVFMDINIKGSLDGIETAQRIKKLHPHISLVFLTSYSDSETMLKAANVQPLGYLNKPVLLKDIESILILVDGHRKHIEENNVEDVTIGAYCYSPRDKTLHHNGTRVSLTKQESLCFYVMLEYQDRHIATEVLMERLWGDTKKRNASLRELLHRLRKKIPTLLIEYRQGLGYKLEEENL